jgi:hypothetical protein
MDVGEWVVNNVVGPLIEFCADLIDFANSIATPIIN